MTDFQGKALYDETCYRVAKAKGMTLPPPVFPVVEIDGDWRHGWCFLADDQGRGAKERNANGSIKQFPSCKFWADLMNPDGEWVRVIGIEAARKIAMLLANPESRTTCLRRLGLLSPEDEGEIDEVERKRQYVTSARALGYVAKALGNEMKLPGISPSLIEAEEGPTSSRRPEKKGVVIDVDSEFFAGATK